MGKAVQGRLPDHQNFSYGFFEQVLERAAGDRECARIGAKGRHDQSLAIIGKAFAAQGPAPLHHDTAWMQMA